MLDTHHFAYQCLNHPQYKNQISYQTYKISETILSEGTAITHLGIVVEGILKAENYTKNGNDLCGTYFEVEDTFPEFLYFTGKRQYTYSLVSVQKSVVAWIPIDIFEEMLKDSDIMSSFVLSISKRGLKNQLLLNCLNYQLIRERIAYWIIVMHSLSQDHLIPLPRSQTMWANTLHVSRSSLNQEIKLMEKQGYFEIEGHYLKVLNIQLLNDLL